ncbi:hypothetical protein DXG01_015259 [Tephrocybe rancida]|nr:hypothetical protein DXG01_015259 [Tephrocybe rancida]
MASLTAADSSPSPVKRSGSVPTEKVAVLTTKSLIATGPKALSLTHANIKVELFESTVSPALDPETHMKKPGRVYMPISISSSEDNEELPTMAECVILGMPIDGLGKPMGHGLGPGPGAS